MDSVVSLNIATGAVAPPFKPELQNGSSGNIVKKVLIVYKDIF